MRNQIARVPASVVAVVVTINRMLGTISGNTHNSIEPLTIRATDGTGAWSRSITLVISVTVVGIWSQPVWVNHAVCYWITSVRVLSNKFSKLIYMYVEFGEFFSRSHRKKFSYLLKNDHYGYCYCHMLSFFKLVVLKWLWFH